MLLRLILIWTIFLGLCFTQAAWRSLSLQKFSSQKYSVNTRWCFRLDEFPIQRAMLCGKKNGLDRKEKKVLKKWALIHLMTPSGLHLGMILLPLTLLLATLKLKESRGIKLLKVFYLFIFCCTDGLFSLKRIWALKTLNSLFKIDLWMAFFYVFAFDFALGSFWISPYSYLLSFLFIGTICLIAKNRRWKLLPGLFVINQLLVGFVFEEKAAPMCLFFSTLITACFSLLLGCSYGFQFVPFFARDLLTGSEFLLKALLNLLSEIQEYSVFAYEENSVLLCLCFSALFFIQIRRRYFVIGALFLVLICSFPLNRQRIFRPSNAKWQRGLPTKWEWLPKKQKEFQKAYYRNGDKCLLLKKGHYLWPRCRR